MNRDVVYGGSFDPPTFGHLEVISKASKLFDTVRVVVAPNYDKPTSAFSPRERVKMIEKMVEGTPFGERVIVSILPPQRYLVDYADDKKCIALIRGLRDDIDFNAEQKIDGTNKKIAPHIETIYIMPSAELSVVSSSWVKSLVGFKGWKKTLKGSVSPYVINELELAWVKKEIHNILDKAHKSRIISLFDFDGIWNRLVETYQVRSYHNLSHIGDMLTNLNVMWVNNEEVKHDDRYATSAYKVTIMQLATIFHDFRRSEHDSARYPIDNKLLMFSKEEDSAFFIEMVMATKHDDTNSVTSVQGAIMADIDLMILASDLETYQEYAGKIRLEYVGKTCDPVAYANGRREFLKNMLFSRKQIFHTEYFQKEFDAIARDNMRKELAKLGVAGTC